MMRGVPGSFEAYFLCCRHAKVNIPNTYILLALQGVSICGAKSQEGRHDGGLLSENEQILTVLLDSLGTWRRFRDVFVSSLEL